MRVYVCVCERVRIIREKFREILFIEENAHDSGEMKDVEKRKQERTRESNMNTNWNLGRYKFIVLISMEEKSSR